MEKVKVLIAGPRSYNDKAKIFKILNHVLQDFINDKEIDLEIVEGEADGIDSIAREWAEENGFTVTPFPANWEDFTEPCLVRYRKDGTKYNALAGPNRNKQMAEYVSGHYAVILWDQKSKGTKDMLSTAKQEKYNITVIEVNLLEI